MFCLCFGRLFAVAVVLLLVFNDSCGNLAAKEVLPSNCLLLDGCAEQWVCSGKSLGNGGVVEPLEETLRNQFADWLGSVAGEAEVVQGHSKEVIVFGGSLGLGASDGCCVR
jgi:hypothetical protein